LWEFRRQFGRYNPLNPIAWSVHLQVDVKKSGSKAGHYRRG
jgi:hypothetical protein